MAFTSLELNRAFPDFNRSLVLDPSLRTGPDHESLFRLVYEARTGSRSADGELADIFHWTLKEETFEVFRKVHGPLPIRYRDWFYSKLVQFCEALIYEGLSTPGLAPDGESAEPKTDQPWNEGFVVLGSKGPPVQNTDVEQAFEPEDNSPEIWLPLIKSVSAAQDRLRQLERILAQTVPASGHEAVRDTLSAKKGTSSEEARVGEDERTQPNHPEPAQPWGRPPPDL